MSKSNNLKEKWHEKMLFIEIEHSMNVMSKQLGDVPFHSNGIREHSVTVRVMRR